MTRIRTGAVLLIGAAALTSCSTSSGTHQPRPSSAAATATTSGRVQQVTIHTTDSFRFTPANIRARVGKLHIVLIDDGSYPHNIAFPALHATSGTVSGNPGEQETSYTVSFDHPGTYDFVCTFHSSAGMTGRVTVS
jgi:plastocyanin